jgi:DNA modification methylase
MSGPEMTAFLTQATSLVVEHSALGSIHFWCMDWRHLALMVAAGQLAFADLLNICVWTKTNAGMGSLYRSAHEFVLVFRHGSTGHRNNVQLGRHGRHRTNVWSYPGANAFVRSSEEGDLLAQHPTPKPVALVADAILDVTARGDLVLDCFLGSGTTLIACERVGRHCRGLELDPLYVDLTIRRWQRLTGEHAINLACGRSFDELAALSEVTA